MPLCAAFALGDAISKACPPGFFRLDNAGACEIAATAANRTYAGVKALSYYPFGCYWHTFTDKVYFNGYTGTIEAETYAQPLCAGAPARAHGHALEQAHARTRTHTHARTHARTHTHSPKQRSTQCTRTRKASNKPQRKHAQTRAQTQCYTHTDTHTNTHTLIHTHTHTQTHTQAHTHAQIHTHTS